MGPEQIAELYRRYGHALYRRAASLVGNPEDAREIVQEVFCQFVRGQSRFAGRSSPFTYLYRIATNLAIDALRRRTTRGATVVLEERQMQAEVRGRSPASVAAASTLAELLAGLDSETVTIAVLAHVDGLTQDEIALALDLSRRTVGKRLKRFLAHTRGRAGLSRKSCFLSRT